MSACVQPGEIDRAPPADAHCRCCHATFTRPLPKPYGTICPHCLIRGDIITLTERPVPPIARRRELSPARR